MVEDCVRMLPELASVLSADEKAKCSLGLPAVSKTTKQVMNIHNRTVVSDYTFSIGAGQSLQPTVISAVNYDTKVQI